MKYFEVVMMNFEIINDIRYISLYFQNIKLGNGPSKRNNELLKSGNVEAIIWHEYDKSLDNIFTASIFWIDYVQWRLQIEYTRLKIILVSVFYVNYPIKPDMM